MNCLDFRRQLAADPHNLTGDFEQHRDECPHCAEAHTRAMRFEESLANALNIEVPAHLVERILFAQAAEKRKQSLIKRPPRWAQFALAASVLLAIGLFGYSRSNHALPLSDLAVAHLPGEPDAWNANPTVPDQLVQRAFAMRGKIAMQAVPAGVSYLSECPLGPYHIVHMVVTQGTERTTVMYVADHAVTKRKDFEQAGWHGRELPAGAGTLVMLAKDAQSFDGLENTWHEAINGARLTAR